MLISSNSIYGEDDISPMGVWSSDINDDLARAKKAGAGASSLSLEHEGIAAPFLKEEENDDVPDLDADEYSPHVEAPRNWYSQAPVIMEPQYTLPPEDLEFANPMRLPQYQGFCSPRPMRTRWDSYQSIEPSPTSAVESPSVQPAEATQPAGAVPPLLESTGTTAAADASAQPTGAPNSIKAKRAKNAAAARRSRARQTVRVQTLEAKLESLTTDNMCLRYEVDSLRSLVERLQLKILSNGLSLDKTETAVAPMSMPPTNPMAGPED